MNILFFRPDEDVAEHGCLRSDAAPAVSIDFLGSLQSYLKFVQENECTG